MSYPAPVGRGTEGPLVSVLIPAFNYGRYLGEALQSLQAQTYRQWECIVLDDGSTDDTPQVATRYAAEDRRIRYIRQSNQGQPAARNNALRAARGDYIQLLDADDLIESDKLRNQVEFLEARRDVDIVYGSVRYFPAESPSERRLSLFGPDAPWMPCTSGAGSDVLLALVEKNIMVINAPLIRRNTFEDVGPFDESLPRADDWDIWTRCALAGKRFEYRDEPGTLALVRSHPVSLTKRDRRLLACSLAIHRKVASAATNGNVRAANQAVIEWLERVCEFAREVDEVVPADHSFILVDEDRVRPELLGYRTIPFTERGGEYSGAPGDSEAAIDELERLRRSDSASFVAFAWTAMWYLDVFVEFREYLDARYKCVTRCGSSVIYDLRLAN
jgi:glycosyltransferase involved in cell wall biosynthesis